MRLSWCSSPPSQFQCPDSAWTPTCSDFELTEVIPYNHNTSRFIFSLPDGTSSGLTVASALVTKAAKEGECLNDKGKPVIRPYTPVTAPDVEGKLVRLRSSACARLQSDDCRC